MRVRKMNQVDVKLYKQPLVHKRGHFPKFIIVRQL